jgi:hypothetical protein
MTTPRGWPERRAGTCSDGDALDLRHPDARRTGRQKDRGNNMHSVPPIPERTTRTAPAEYACDSYLPKPSEGVVLARGGRTFEDRRTFISLRTSPLGSPSPYGYHRDAEEHQGRPDEDRALDALPTSCSTVDSTRRRDAPSSVPRQVKAEGCFADPHLVLLKATGSV